MGPGRDGALSGAHMGGHMGGGGGALPLSLEGRTHWH